MQRPERRPVRGGKPGRRIARLGRQGAHAPLLLDGEIISVASKKKRAGVATALLDRALAVYVQNDIEFHRPDVRAQYELSVRYGISPYDAAYLWVAGLLQAPLATFDGKLAQAARAHLGAPG